MIIRKFGEKFQFDPDSKPTPFPLPLYQDLARIMLL